MMKRPSWDEYFFGFTEQVAVRSTCLRRKIGAIAVKNKRILCTGYNGSPPGTANCCDIGSCLREEMEIPSGERHELCRAIHAEQNLIVQAALEGIVLRGCTIYCTTQPCFICMKLIVALEPYAIAFKNPYPDERTSDMLDAVARKEIFLKKQDYEKWIFL